MWGGGGGIVPAHTTVCTTLAHLIMNVWCKTVPKYCRWALSVGEKIIPERIIEERDPTA